MKAFVNTKAVQVAVDGLCDRRGCRGHDRRLDYQSVVAESASDRWKRYEVLVELAPASGFVKVGDGEPHLFCSARDRELHALALPFGRVLDLQAEVDVFREPRDGVVAFREAGASFEHDLRILLRDEFQRQEYEVVLDDERFSESVALRGSCDELVPFFLVFMQVHRSPRFRGASRLFYPDSVSRILPPFACPPSRRTP